MDALIVAQSFLGGGCGVAAIQLIRPLIDKASGRKRSRIDVAQRVNEMALELIEPLERRARAAEQRADELSRKLDEMYAELDEWVSWSRMAKRDLESHDITVVPFPHRRFGQMNGAS